MSEERIRRLMKITESMKQLPKEQRPYEKFQINGPEQLSDSELLAIILRTGTQGVSSLALAGHILNFSESYEGLLGLQHLSIKDLMKLKGIGKVKAIQIKCIGELSRRIAKSAAGKKLDFKNPKTIASYYMEDLRHQEQEMLLLIMLDTKNAFLGDVMISKGTVNASLISPREIFLTALQFHAVNIILIHNHPSGNPHPSNEDVQVTKRVQSAGEMLGIHLLDHIVIGDQSYVSLWQEELLQR